MRTLLFLIITCCCSSLLGEEPLVIVHGDDNWAPNEFRDADGRLVGIHIDLIQLAAAELGIEVKFVAVPWQRALRMMESGEADALSYASFSEQRDKYLLYLPGNIINQTQSRFVYSVQRNFAELSTDWANTSIGIIRGYDYGDDFDLQRFASVAYARKEDQLIDMLNGGRVDVILANFERLRYQLAGSKKLAELAVSKEIVLSHDIYLTFSKVRKNHTLAARFAAVIPGIRRSKVYRQKVERYFQAEIGDKSQR